MCYEGGSKNKPFAITGRSKLEYVTLSEARSSEIPDYPFYRKWVWSRLACSSFFTK